MINIADEHFLIQFRTDQEAEEEYYWTILNSAGQIIDLSYALIQRLSASIMVWKKTIKKKDGCYKVILMNERKEGEYWKFVQLEFGPDASLISIVEEKLESEHPPKICADSSERFYSVT